MKLLEGVTAEASFSPCGTYRYALTRDWYPKRAGHVLCGLMDTDGSATQSGAATFTTLSERLAQDVASLVRSLGGLASVRSRMPYRTASRSAFRVSVRTPAVPFHLERKAGRYVSVPKMPIMRKVTRIEPVGSAECVCIEVAAEDGLYVTNDFVVTHNTYASLGLEAGEHPKVMSERLGHATTAITNDIYSHVTPRMDADLAERQARRIFGEREGAR